MYNPVNGVFMEQDPTGFVAGDDNLYRFVGNDPANATDPTGLIGKDWDDVARQEKARENAGWTVTKAVDVLKEQIAEWKTAGYNFAANILQAFIKNTGQGYTPNESDITEVQEHSVSMVRYWLNTQLGSYEHWQKIDSEDIEFAHHVRWGSLLFGGEIRNDPNLFNAYGGADLTLTGKFVKKGTVGNVLTGRYPTVTADVNVKIADTWTFLNTGPLGMRLFHRAYNAGYYLEKNCGYHSVRTTVTFEQSYEGFVPEEEYLK
jgi:uncharacterized protein RhaS with RHS repeats